MLSVPIIRRSFAVSALVALVLASLAVSCGGGEGTTEGQVGVVVSILPQAEFVERVGGERVDVTVMVPPGASPHTYEPTPGQMKALAKADMYAKVGTEIGFEVVWMERLLANANKDMLVVDCSQGVEQAEMADTHGHEGENPDDEQGGMDPHIWMSPLNSKMMVQSISYGLMEVDPDNRAYYERNRDAYLEELTRLDQDIRDGLSEMTSRRFMVYHPAFGYFAREYDLTMLPIEEEGKEPTAAGIAHLIDQADQYDVKVIFASPQFNQQSAEVIADEIGGRVALIDPLARDYVKNLRTLLGELVQAME